MSFRDLNIGKKLFLSFSLLGLVIIGIGALSLTLFSRMNEQTLDVTDNIVPGIMIVSQTSEAVSSFRRYQLGYQLVLDNPQKTSTSIKLTHCVHKWTRAGKIRTVCVQCGR